MAEKPSPNPAPSALPRVLGVPGAVLLGLGSIVGTGIFVSVGLAAEIAGPSVLLAVALGAIVAIFNGLSSAALAASHPVSGGTYEYGYRYLSPALGRLAGFTFLCAKSASAATAALGFAGYVTTALDVAASSVLQRAIAIGLVAVLTLVVAGGMSRSHRANAIIVGVTLLALLVFVASGAARAVESGPARFQPFLPADGVGSVLHATALMFVAYTGYGRIATLGEEVRSPERNIPRAVIVTLLASLAIYAAVTAVAVGALGAAGLAEATLRGHAPLEHAARTFSVPGIAELMALGAITAMAGVILNLVLGLSRVVLAMARRRDLPSALASIDERGSPRRAVLLTGAAIAILAAIGNIGVTWSFSAFTVLVYYALTNLAALRLDLGRHRLRRIVAALGLLSCAGLLPWIDPAILVAGSIAIGVAMVAFEVARRARSS